MSFTINRLCNLFPKHEALKVAEVLRQANDIADWELVRAIYRQCIDIANDQHSNYIPDAIVGFLAEAMSRLSSNYIDQKDRMAQHALAVFADVEEHELCNKRLFRELYSDGRFTRFSQYSSHDGISRKSTTSSSPQRPPPFESIVETCRRIRDVDDLKRIIRNSNTSGIVGGSTNYGRYFNVHGNNGREASDLDLVLVIEDYSAIDAIAAMIAAHPALLDASVESIKDRYRIFQSSKFDDGRTVFSQKLKMWPSGVSDPMMEWAETPACYLLSLHFISLDVLKWILVEDATELSREAASSKRTVRDFRATSTSRLDHQRSFGGRDQWLELETEKTQGGYLRRSRVYVIDRDRHYYPGMFQNLIFPGFETRWDDLDIKEELDLFRWKMISRLRLERRIRPNEYLRLSFSHTRSEIFAPHIAWSIDASAVVT